jgi:hypothetical protein
MTRRRLPRHVHGFVDHNGKARFYFRRKGQPNIPLPGLPWSTEFMAKYQEAIGIKPAVSSEVLGSRLN